MKRALLILLAAGCAPGFDDPTTVEDLRVLAITAEPPETMMDVGEFTNLERLPSSTAELSGRVPSLVAALPDAFPPVTMRALIADPRQEGRPMRVQARLCGAPEGRERERGMGPALVRDTIGRQGCDGGVPLGEPFVVVPHHGTAVAEVSFTPTRALLLSALMADPLGLVFNLPVTVEFTVEAGGERDVARKRAIFAPRLLPDQPPNANPALAGLGTRAGDDAPIVPVDLSSPEPIAVEPGGRLRFFPTGTPEMYAAREYERATGRLFVREGIKEVLRFAFLSTEGSFAPGSISTQPSAVREGPPLQGPSVVYRAPAEAKGERLVPLWIVTRDERGGSSVARLQIRLQ